MCILSHLLGRNSDTHETATKLHNKSLDEALSYLQREQRLLSPGFWLPLGKYVRRQRPPSKAFFVCVRYLLFVSTAPTPPTNRRLFIFFVFGSSFLLSRALFFSRLFVCWTTSRRRSAMTLFLSAPAMFFW